MQGILHFYHAYEEEEEEKYNKNALKKKSNSTQINLAENVFNPYLDIEGSILLVWW